MCGIAGIMTGEGSRPDDDLLDRLAAALRHRGPDGEGRHVGDDTGLVQTRLAIIDLETGDQPIYGPDGEVGPALVANAEVYNYLELRKAMPEAAFRARSDCEPPLHLYLRHGVCFAEHLRGMYAIAIYDPGAKRLVLARDRFGIKPLYYYQSADGFAFASEYQALVAAGWLTPELNEQSRDELLQLQFTTGADTPLTGVQRVLPGETIVIERGKITERHLIAALPAHAPVVRQPTLALAELDEVLEDAVGIHQRSDVPYGMFFSGGIDSSVLLAMMARLNAEPVRALTAGFPDAAVHDERDHARAIARAVGAEHIQVAFTEDDFWALLPVVTAAMDDPAADYAVLPSYKLAAEASRAGLKVVLSGEGGDELFAGYGRYRRARRPKLLGGRPMWRSGALEGLGILRERRRDWGRGIEATETEIPTGLTRLQAIQAADCAHWLPNDLLTKLDRCLMAHGVEGRVPFLDPRVAAFAFRLPDRLKIRGKLGKWLLRKWLETALPAAEPFSRKRGFTVPVGDWIAARGARLAPLVAAQPGVAEACYADAVHRLFATLEGSRQKQRGRAAWVVLYYALWHRCHILGRAPEGDVFETLSAAA